MTKIIQQAISVDNEILISIHVHDYQSKIVKEHEFMIDGGLEYYRYGFPYMGKRNQVELINKNICQFEILFLDETSSFDDIVKKLVWGVQLNSKGAVHPIKWKKITNLSTAHLKNILKNVKIINTIHRLAINTELQRRKKNS